MLDWIMTEDASLFASRIFYVNLDPPLLSLRFRTNICSADSLTCFCTNIWDNVSFCFMGRVADIR